LSTQEVKQRPQVAKMLANKERWGNLQHLGSFTENGACLPEIILENPKKVGALKRQARSVSPKAFLIACKAIEHASLDEWQSLLNKVRRFNEPQVVFEPKPHVEWKGTENVASWKKKNKKNEEEQPEEFTPTSPEKASLLERTLREAEQHLAKELEKEKKKKFKVDQWKENAEKRKEDEKLKKQKDKEMKKKNSGKNSAGSSAKAKKNQSGFGSWSSSSSKAAA